MHINGSFLRTVDGNPIGCYGLDMNNVIEEYLDVKTKKMRPPVIKEDDESITAEFRNGDMLSTPYMSDIVEYFNLLHIEKNIGSINLYFKDENNKAVPAQKFSENRLKFLEQHLNIAYEHQNFERADKIKTDIAEIKHALNL
jgi:hypothetical protein